MTSIALSNGQATGGDAITADRVETKYRVESGAASRLLRALTKELPLHRFTGEGANRLPDPHQFVTTVYFDTAQHDYLRAASSNLEHNVKIRAREYYDLHPSLAELATSPTQIVRYQPWVWLEVKRRAEGRTTKRRLRLPKSEVPSFLRGEHAAFGATGDSVHAQREREGSDPGLSELLDAYRTQAEPLDASVIVNYRRIALQDAAGTLRITVDADIGFYRPPADLWTRTHALVRGTFGAPAASERHLLVEVKSSAELPAWLARTLVDVRAEPIGYSKFVRAGQAVYGLV